MTLEQMLAARMSGLQITVYNERKCLIMIMTSADRPIPEMKPLTAFEADQVKMLENAISDLENVDYSLLEEEMGSIQRSAPVFDVDVVNTCASGCVVK
jgi:hypothetical protein